MIKMMLRRSKIWFFGLSIVLITYLTSPAISLAWSGNMLSNPGAETGNLVSWTTDDILAVVASKSQKESSGWVYPHSGDWFFNMCGQAVGSAITERVLYQDIDMSSYASDIDADLVLFQASTYLQTEDVQTMSGADYAQLTLYFLDEFASEIDSTSTGLVQSPNLTWIQQILNGSVPAETRTIRYELLGRKEEGTWLNAFFDVAELQMAVIPEPATLLLLGLGGLALLKKHRRINP